MKKSTMLIVLFIFLMNNVYMQTTAGYGKDSMPDCKAVFQFYFNDSIRTLVEAYPYQFNDYSIGDATQRIWDFGDGTTSNEINPLHFYEHYSDTVMACLTITTATGCQSDFCRTFIVGQPDIQPECNAYFYFYRDSVENIGNFRFQAAYDNDNLTSIWDFGDGTLSGEQNPLHRFPGEGAYNVCHTRTKSDGQVCTYCQMVYAGKDTMQTDCRTYFDIQTLESYPLQYHFVPYSSDSIGWYYWDFGDGHQVYDNSPIHQFEYSGYYTVCLTAKAINGCKSYYCTTLYFEGKTEDCQAYWFGYPVDQTPISSVRPPDSVPFPALNTYMFFDQSRGMPVSWHWSFGDGSESYERDPIHTYTNPGTYTICLEILTADSCTSQYCDSILVGIQEPCSLFGTVLDYTGLDACGLIIQLDNGPILEPAVIVPDFILKAGQRVRLSYTELDDLASICMAGRIVRIDCIEEVSECHAYFWHYNLDWVSSLPPIYQFVSDTSQVIVSWQWDLGDGTISFEKSPQHRFEFSGYYTICLTTTTADRCSDTYCETSYFEGRYPEPGLCNYRLSIQTDMIVSSQYNCDGSASVSLIDAFGNKAEAQSFWWSTGSQESSVEGLCTSSEYQVTAIDPDGCYITGSFMFSGGSSMPYDTLWGNWEYEKDGMKFAFCLPVFSADYNCVWEFGDGTVSQGSNVNHTYTAEGEYIVILKVYDTEGNIALTREIAVNTDGATGLTDHSSDFIRAVHPVPVKDILHIELVSAASHQEILAIYNTAGQQVLIKEINIPAGSATLTLDVANLPAGVYCGLIKSDSGGNTQFRFIK